METFNWSIKRTRLCEFRVYVQLPNFLNHTPSITSSIDRQHRNGQKAAAITNEKSGKLDQQIVQAIIQACDEILDGNLRDQSIVDAIQGGAGTSANMNANEVIANRAIETCGTKGDYSIVHPNDHVNMSQSTNDVIPTAGKITVLKITSTNDQRT